MSSNPIYQNEIDLTENEESDSHYETIVQSNLVYQNDIHFTTTENSKSIYGDDRYYNDEYLKEHYGVYETPKHVLDEGILEASKVTEITQSQNKVGFEERGYDLADNTDERASMPSTPNLPSSTSCNWKLITLIILLTACFVSSVITVYIFTLQGNITIVFLLNLVT